MGKIWIEKEHYVLWSKPKRKTLNIEITSNKIEIPLLEKRELVQRISKINEKDRCKIGWIYIGSIQMILSTTFRE